MVSATASNITLSSSVNAFSSSDWISNKPSTRSLKTRGTQSSDFVFFGGSGEGMYRSSFATSFARTVLPFRATQGMIPFSSSREMVKPSSFLLRFPLPASYMIKRRLGWTVNKETCGYPNFSLIRATASRIISDRSSVEVTLLLTSETKVNWSARRLRSLYSRALSTARAILSARARRISRSLG